MPAMVAVVLDTNVIVSGHLKEGRPESTVLQLFYGGRIDLLVSNPILTEYEEVLRRPKFGFSPPHIDRFLQRIRSAARHVTPSVKVAVCKDPDDDRFLECALAGHADTLVTGNKRHFPAREFEGIPILNAAEFLAQFAVDSSLTSRP